jgi:glutamyl-tRNA synthetase
MTVRTRIAPSPTGDPHVGTAYVALFNYALAQKHGGQFILRIEDTDRQRSNLASEAMIYNALRWLGIEWDEGPDTGGPFGPYRQSERTDIYRDHVERLIAKGEAYPCFCTRERLAEVRERQKAEKSSFLGYDGECRTLDPEVAKQRRDAGEEHVIRLKMPKEGTMVVEDLLRGEVTFELASIDDQVLMKSDGFPTYHLANVVDDRLMGITHVIRAEEWISSLPKHYQLYEAFGWERPVFCHLPLLRNNDRSKISKRKNPVSLNYFRRAGYLPEAMLNFLALMGWSMGEDREEFTLQEFIEAFSLDKVSLGEPVFDMEKFTWLNGKYIRNLSPAELRDRIRDELYHEDYWEKVVELAQERFDRLSDFASYSPFFFCGEVEYDEQAKSKLVAKKKTAPETAKALRVLVEQYIDPIMDWTHETVEAALRQYCEDKGWKPGELFMPVRIAVTGAAATPPLFETMTVLGKEMCRSRLRQAIEVLRTMK